MNKVSQKQKLSKSNNNIKKTTKTTTTTKTKRNISTRPKRKLAPLAHHTTTTQTTQNKFNKHDNNTSSSLNATIDLIQNPITTTSVMTMARSWDEGWQPRARVVPAGQPKGLPPKIVHTQVKLTPGEIQAEEDRQRYIVKEFYKTAAVWNPNPKLVKCNDINALEHYLWDHHVRLRWYRGKIADKANHHVRRRYFRTHISIQKKIIRFIEDKIFALKGELRVPKLYEPLVPNHHDKLNPFMNQIKIVERVVRDYDYPMKDVYEPLARAPKQWEGSSAQRVQQI